MTGLIPTQVGAVYREVGDSIFDYLPALGVSPVGLDRTLELEVREDRLRRFRQTEWPSPSIARDPSTSAWVSRVRSGSATDGGSRRAWSQPTPRRSASATSCSRAVVEEHVTDPMDAQMLVTYANGADVAVLDARLAALADESQGCTSSTGPACERPKIRRPRPRRGSTI